MKIISYLPILLIYACSTVPSPVENGNASNAFYRVQKGDNLYRIGLRFGQTTDTLAQWNNLNNIHQLEVGQLLRVIAPTKQNISQKSKPTTPQNPTPKADFIRPAQGDIDKLPKGIAIYNQRGTPVYAAASGTVVFHQHTAAYGDLIMIEHSNKEITAYGFVQNAKVQLMQTVKQGDLIAQIGTAPTGKSRLYFDLRRNKKAVDPTSYF